MDTRIHEYDIIILKSGGFMIVRTWHGIVPVEKSVSFRQYLLETGVAEAKATPGNLGVFTHDLRQVEFQHFFMISYWENMTAVKNFAGPEPHIAVTYPEDELFGLISDPIVLHHEVKSVPDDYIF
jgi:hypothetical protein